MKANERKWLTIVACITLCSIMLMLLVSFIVDPLFQYRVKETGYIVSGRYSGAGIIKNYDYDTIMLGSSMVQNFNTELMNTELHCQSIHIGISGMTDEDQLEYIALANKTGKAETYYLCIDISQFKEKTETNTVDYLMRDDIFSKLKYALFFDALLKYTPLDIILTIMQIYNLPIPQSLYYQTDIDYYGYWGHKFSYSEEGVLSGYQLGKNSVSSVELTDLYKTMTGEIDAYFSKIDQLNEEFIFFFPPYSSLYWANAQKEAYYDTFLDAKDYFIDNCLKRGVRVYDFQSADFTTQLDYYKDITHYCPAINDWMVHAFANGDYMVNQDNQGLFREQLNQNTDLFLERHPHIFD